MNLAQKAQANNNSTSHPTIAAKPFRLSKVRIGDGPFKEAMDLDVSYLLQLEPDRLLAPVYKEAGMPLKAPLYGGWEGIGLSSHMIGHYMSACAEAYAAGAEGNFVERLMYIVDELERVANAHDDGFISGIPRGRGVFEEVSRGQIESKGFDLNGAWAPWYTYHKLMAGLRDAYNLAGIEKARAMLIVTADYALKVTEPLDETQLQQMLDCEFGGMSEAAADVYAITGDEKYLTLARRFDHKIITEPLAAGDDPLPLKHANTQIPKALGEAKLYELIGTERGKQIALHFWDHVVNHHSYAIGAHSDGEYFGPADQLAHRLSPHTCEVCNSYNMLRLASHLFSWTADPSIPEFCENVLYNHILASQNPDDGMMCYFVPLKSGSTREYSTPFDSFWCCVGTGIENHVLYGDNIYFQNERTLWINLFAPSHLDWSELGVKIKQETKMPLEGSSKLTLGIDKPTSFTLNLRRPSWAGNGFEVSVNGEVLPTKTDPGAYVSIEREWQDKDTIEVKLPMSLRIAPMPDKESRVAICYGPLVLAGDLGDSSNEPTIPTIVSDGSKPDSWLTPVEGQPCRFRTNNVGSPEDFELAPFYQFHKARHAVYFDWFTTDEWEKWRDAYAQEQERLAQLDRRTVDEVVFGEMQPERDHQFEGEGTRHSYFSDRPFRYADQNGWFGATIQLDPDKPIELLITYWGGDQDGRYYDIEFEGQHIKTESLENSQGEAFFEQSYTLPESLTQGKSQGRIRFIGRKGRSPRVFGLRVMRSKDE